MADIALQDSMSLGESGHPPTLPLSNLSLKTTVNGKSVVLKNYTLYAPHPSGPPHPGVQRMVTGGSSKVMIEGYYVSRKGDSIADGDNINEGYSKVSIGG